MKTFYATFTQSSPTPKAYLEIKAPDEGLARLVARAILDKNWAFIYSAERTDFSKQVQRYRLYPCGKSPIKVEEADREYWTEKVKELHNGT